MLRVSVTIPEEVYELYKPLSVLAGAGVGYYLANVIGKYGPEPDEGILSECRELAESDGVHYLSEVCSPPSSGRRPSWGYKRVVLLADGRGSTVEGMAVLATLAVERGIPFSVGATMVLSKHIDDELSTLSNSSRLLSEVLLSELRG